MMQSEDWDKLTERLSETGFTKPGMRDYLEGCDGMETIPYYQRTRYGDDEMAWQVWITRKADTGLYEPDGYNAVLIRTHPVPHDVFGSIDTGELEERMKRIDWNKFDIREKNIEELAQTSDIVDDVLQLAGSKSSKARDVAQRLQLRYWLHTPIEQRINIVKNIYRYEKRASFDLHGDIGDIHAKEAYNLLSGRGVLKFHREQDRPDIFSGVWKQFHNNILQTYPAYDLMLLLRSLPIHELQNDSQGPQLIYDLIQGERVPIHLGRFGEPAFIEADPKEQSVRMYSPATTELNPAAYQLNDAQRHLFKKAISAKDTPEKKNKQKRRGRSI